MSDSDRTHLKRFAVLVKSNAEVEAGAMPTEQDLAAMTRFNDELVESGAMLAGEGFLPAPTAHASDTRRETSESSMDPSRIPSHWSRATGSSRPPLSVRRST